MDKTLYIAFIKFYQTDDIKELIGEIDINLMQQENVECLYYIFPLIERIILEIFKLVPGANIEHLEQGIMKTPISIIDSNPTNCVMPSNVIDLIRKYYNEDGIRNIVLHNNYENKDIKINFTELISLLSKLLSILKYKLSEVSNENFEDIEYL